VLGAIVFTIAVGLVDVRSLRAILRESPGEFRLAMITAAVVVGVGVEPGILLAMGLSLLRHVRHSYRPHTAVLVEDKGIWQPVHASPGAMTADGLIVFRFGADLFYANAARFAVRARASTAAQPRSVTRAPPTRAPRLQHPPRRRERPADRPSRSCRTRIAPCEDASARSPRDRCRTPAI